jgi:hypothetical protein
MNDGNRLYDTCNLCGRSRIQHTVILHNFVEDKPVQRAKRKAYLREWYIQGNGGKWASLVGEVFGHPQFDDGRVIVTSPILKLDIPGRSAETMNTVYMLEGKRG